MSAGAVDVHVLKQSGRVQRFERIIDTARIELATGTGLEIGTDRIGFDTPIALDNDGTDGLRNRGARRRNSYDGRTEKKAPEDNTAKR